MTDNTAFNSSVESDGELMRQQPTITKESEKPAYLITFRLLVSIIAAVMGSLQFGYNTGVINAPELVIKKFMNESRAEKTGKYLDPDALLRDWSITVAIFAIGGMIGGVLAGWWADYFGRKKGMLINDVVGIIGGALMGFSKLAMSYEMIIIGRLIIGFNCGLFTGLAPIYLSEIASSNIRGALGTVHQLGVVTGIFLSQLLGFSEILGNENLWELLLGLAVLPVILQLVLLPFCPESPRYLLISKGLEAEAEKALIILRGTPDIQSDIVEMKEEQRQNDQETKIGFLQLFRQASLRKPLIISIVMHLSQQFSGINVIFYYSFSLFRSAGITYTSAIHSTSGVGAILILMTIISIPLMEIAGRRFLHLVGLCGMFVFSILVTISLTYNATISSFKIISIITAFLFVAFFAIGPGSVPWLLGAELFSQGPRPAAMSICVLANWIANFVVGFTFPYLQKGLKNLSFLPFTFLLALFVVFTFFFLPETKNKTFEEIAMLFRKNNKNGIIPSEDSSLVSFKKM